jgi:hypothetical protein
MVAAGCTVARAAWPPGRPGVQGGRAKAGPPRLRLRLQTEGRPGFRARRGNFQVELSSGAGLHLKGSEDGVPIFEIIP